MVKLVVSTATCSLSSLESSSSSLEAFEYNTRDGLGGAAGKVAIGRAVHPLS